MAADDNSDITNAEFAQFQHLIYQIAGISLADSKKVLLVGRLGKRLKHLGLSSFSEYYQIVSKRSEPGELQTMVDLLTTNETYFFREPKHFDMLSTIAEQADRSRVFRVWSAACSSGEEPYSIAMVLDECLASTPWEVLGTDISSQVLQGALRGLYPLERARQMPQACMRKYCLRGTGDYAGSLLIQRELRSRVKFQQVNLNTTLPELGLFDMIFLRNVMIYFNDDTKRQVLARVLSTLKRGGHLCVGHSESITNLASGVESVAPAIYCKS